MIPRSSRGPRQRPAETEALAAYLGERIGVSFEGPRRPYLWAAVAAEAERAGMTPSGEYQRLLARDAVAFHRLVAAVTVGETYFFREPRHLDLLREAILPDVRARLGADHVLRVWSAACATGEEAYTLAMALDDAGLDGRYRILATDLSDAAIEAAENALYRPRSLRTLNNHQRRAYFEPEGDALRVRSRFRERVVFRAHNLMDAPPTVGGAPWAPDVIFVRNALIYFTPTAIAAVARRLTDALAPGGWLVTGSADPPLEADGLQSVATAHGFAYRRVPGAERAPEARPSPGRRRAAGDAAAGGRAAQRNSDAAQERSSSARQPPEPQDVLAAAHGALRHGDYGRAAALATVVIADGSANAAPHAVLVRALGSAGRSDDAIEAANAAVARFPLDAELRYAHAVALLDAGRAADAADAAAVAAYLRPELAVVHLTLGHARRRCGDLEGARRSFRNARALLEALPADADVPLASGERAAQLAAVASAQEARCSPSPERSVRGAR